jgi:tRNA(Ser,Leu) C12 N-acetylase TAN1/23S rRNA U2552 (ribose-2'-O)-methylase RlmE/FtsJ
MKAECTLIITVPAGFEYEARKEIEGLILGSKVRSLFFKGNVLVESPQDDSQTVTKLRNAETLYVSHVYPVQAEVKIASGKEGIPRFFAPLADKIKATDSFAVRCQRRGRHDFSSRDVEKQLGSMLEKSTGATVDLKNPGKIVVVQIFQNKAFVGVTEAVNLLVKPIRVFRKYGKGERPLTRAEHKLKEAIEAFNVEVKPDYEVLDLGAAPGGWTKILASSARRVVAVDPACLSSKVFSLPNVVHLQCKAGEIPESVGFFDLVTNDMNIAPSESARIMVAVASHLRKNGTGIMTVKFVTRRRKKHVEETLEILKEKYTGFKTKRLPHNRYETTVYMKKA